MREPQREGCILLLSQSDSVLAVLNFHSCHNFIIFSFLRYSVNVGSVHKFSNAAALSLINTHLSVCASILSWVIVMYITTKRLKMMDLLQGIIVGLVGMFAWSFSNSLIIHQAKTKQITTVKEV